MDAEADDAVLCVSRAGEEAETPLRGGLVGRSRR